MADWLTVIDEVVAELGEPKVAVTEPQLLHRERGDCRRRCWVWFPNNINHNIAVDQYARDLWEITAASHAGTRTTFVRKGEPSASQMRAVLVLAGVLGSEYAPTPAVA